MPERAAHLRQLRSVAGALLATGWALGCSVQESDRLDLVIKSPEDGPRPQSLLVRVRDDGPPRAVGAGVYLPPPADLQDAAQRISLKPASPFVGGVTVYIIGCAVQATCDAGGALGPECRCPSPLSFGASAADVKGHTELVVALGPWQDACDRDADGVVDCGVDPGCCAHVPAEARARISDCAEVAPSADCAADRCRPDRAHPFLASEPTADEVRRDATLATRNAAVCEDGLDNDCAGPPDVPCAGVDADGDGYTVDGSPPDCDDANRNVHPGQKDNCTNGIDDNCDPKDDVCDEDGDGTADDLDCAPGDPTRHLGAADPCGDGIDQDCDGGDPVCIPDDLDGDGVPCPGVDPSGDHKCVGPGQDCDDLNAGIHPALPEEHIEAAEERCDPTNTMTPSDENCDGVAEVCPPDDQDGDGARARSAGGADCDDTDPLRFPGAPERCGDGIDQDCDGADAPCGSTQDSDGDGWAAGVDCNDKERSIFPGAVEVCNGGDDDCDGVADEGNPLQLVVDGPVADARCGDECPTDAPCRCYTAPQACAPDPAAPERKTILCIGVSAGRYAEVCNGFDDDCDGGLNNVAGQMGLLSRPCYTGPLGTENVGVCKGSLSYCVAPAHAADDDPMNWGPCDGEVLPVDEVCNAFDDDCDGQSNEDAGGRALEMECYPCPGGMPGFGPCVRGTSVCVNGAFAPCDGHHCPEPEVCNARDDDCDGRVDVDGAAPITRPCYSGPGNTRNVGECHDGIATCVNGDFIGCAGEALPGDERCDDEDDDCDGDTDEGLVRSCGMTDVGVCSFGQQQCRRGDWGMCVGDVSPGQEICNNEDDDCDGHVDNDVTRPCGDDTGACQRGTEVCAAGGWEGVCRGAIGPATEVCNGMDDDCDGQTDENLDEPCSTGLADPCGDGVRHCVGGRMGACERVPRPDAERCDMLDNNCNGQVDEGIPLGRDCTRGTGACLAHGALVCDGNGDTTCDARPGDPGVEVCNGVDDDCNTVVDDGGNTLCQNGNTCDGMAGCRCRNGAGCQAPQHCGANGCE